ncbi:MAG: F0F1 ATP synthase subunit epsilon [Clostridia bacterium]|nr:F0F1 ATP synthase subunit epsilon [Clostridia bacterium]
MSTFKLIISSPDGDKFKGEAERITLRGSEGDLAVLAGHIPFITAVKPCDVKITLDDGSEKIGRTDGGLLTVSNSVTTLLSGTFDWK